MKTHTSISHFTGKEQNNLHCIKKKIIDHLHPLIIYYLGSNVDYSITRSCLASERKTEEWQFECDLLVILPNNVTPQQNVLGDIERLVEPFGMVEITAYTLDSFVQHLQEGDAVMSHIRRAAIILYEKDNATQQLPQPVKKKAEEQVTPEEQRQIVPTEQALNDRILQQVQTFLELVPANRFNKGIRKLLIVYLRKELCVGVENFFEDFITDLEIFFDLLDTIEEEGIKNEAA